MSEKGNEISVPADEEEQVGGGRGKGGGGGDETSARADSDSNASVPEPPEPAGSGSKSLFDDVDTGRRRGGRSGGAAGATVIGESIRAAVGTASRGLACEVQVGKGPVAPYTVQRSAVHLEIGLNQDRSEMAEHDRSQKVAAETKRSMRCGVKLSLDTPVDLTPRSMVSSKSASCEGLVRGKARYSRREVRRTRGEENKKKKT